MRVFTQIEARKASPDEVHTFTSEAEMACLKGAGEIDEKSILKFPETSKMSTTKGKKEGDITVFREGIVCIIQEWFQKPICGKKENGNM